MQKLKKAFDACSNPPHFRGVKTPITELLDAEDKPKRDANANPKRDGDKKEHGRREKGAQLQSRQNTARDFRRHTKNPVSSPLASNAPTLPPRLKGGKSPTMPSVNSLMTSRATDAPGATKRVASDQNARFLRKNGRTNSTAKRSNTGNRSSSGKAKPPTKRKAHRRLHPNPLLSPRKKIIGPKLPGNSHRRTRPTTLCNPV
jgi:hypothetical protein